MKKSPSKEMLNTQASNKLNLTNNTGNSSNIFTYNYNKQSSSTNKPYLVAIEQYRKLCLKTYATPNNNFITTLKNEKIALYLDMYGIKDINVINKVIGAFHYFKQIILAPFDPNSNKFIFNF